MVQKEIIIGAVALMVFGGAVLFMANSSGVPAVTESDAQTAAVEDATQEAATPKPEGLFSGSFADLLKSADSLECSFVDEADGAKTEGTVYVSGGKVRGNFTSTVEGATVHSSMIQDSESVYVWSEAMPQGIKMKASVATANDAAPPQPGLMDMKKVMDYNCKPWKTDAAWFVAPPNIEFMSL